MAKINLLPKSIFELIAAGEVVERPASVVKELLENSIDAGAKKITIEIQNGGIRYIRVTDDGCGISRDDIPLAFTSHATSKINSASDLDSIFTLGFRGEALASISAVSKAEIITKTAEDFSGTRYEVTGGENTAFEDAGCPDGTTIIIRNLFYNTPARMKFLKKDSSEGNFVSGIVEKIALSHPDISLRLIKDGKEALFTTGDGNLLLACEAIFGKAFSNGLIELNDCINGIKIHGFISEPFNARATRSMQNFFVNNRYVKNKTMFAALEEAYKGSIMVGKHPSCVLFIEIPPETVDVNVHPAKTEVRFSDEKRIFDCIYHSVKNAVNGDKRLPQMQINKVNPVSVSNNYIDSKKEQLKIFTDLLDEGNRVVSSPKAFEYATAEDDEPVLVTLNQNKPVRESEKLEQVVDVKAFDENENNDFRIIGEAFKTYIIIEKNKKLLVIDKHAAHERMLYEKLKSQINNQSTQILLKPVNVPLSKEEYSAVIENIDVITANGFSVEDFGDGSVIVRECPIDLTIEDVKDFIVEIAGYLIKNKKEILTEKQDWILHNIACRAAVKAGNKTTEYETAKFVEKLLSMPEIRYCPHGRPVMIELTQYMIEKQFGRIQ